jgi:hypothetical protein
MVYSSRNRQASNDILACGIYRTIIQWVLAGCSLYEFERHRWPSWLEMALHYRRNHYHTSRNLRLCILPQLATRREEDLVDDRGRTRSVNKAYAGYWTSWQAAMEQSEGQENLLQLAHLLPSHVIRDLEQRWSAACYGILVEELR